MLWALLCPFPCELCSGVKTVTCMQILLSNVCCVMLRYALLYRARTSSSCMSSRMNKRVLCHCIVQCKRACIHRKSFFLSFDDV